MCAMISGSHHAEASFDSDLRCPRVSNLFSLLALAHILASRIQQHKAGFPEIFRFTDSALVAVGFEGVE
jgi:hypothetical protein